jgi:hypothetical protein
MGRIYLRLAGTIIVAEIVRTSAGNAGRGAYHLPQLCAEKKTMRRLLLAIVAAVPSLLSAQTGTGPYVLIGTLRRLEGRDFEFDAGIARHWQWHRDHHDPYVWYAWESRFGDRVGALVFASFNHSAGSLDSAVSPAEDRADWRVTGAPQSQFTNLEMYRYLPDLSRGTGDPGPAVLLEYTTVDVQPSAASAFEAKLRTGQPSLKGETLWYRLVTGGPVPRYLRLRPRQKLSAATEDADDQVLAQASAVITRVNVELLVSQPSLTIDVAGAGRNGN